MVAEVDEIQGREGIRARVYQDATRKGSVRVRSQNHARRKMAGLGCGVVRKTRADRSALRVSRKGQARVGLCAPLLPKLSQKKGRRRRKKKPIPSAHSTSCGLSCWSRLTAPGGVTESLRRNAGARGSAARGRAKLVVPRGNAIHESRVQPTIVGAPGRRHPAHRANGLSSSQLRSMLRGLTSSGPPAGERPVREELGQGKEGQIAFSGATAATPGGGPPSRCVASHPGGRPPVRAPWPTVLWPLPQDPDRAAPLRAVREQAPLRGKVSGLSRYRSASATPGRTWN